MKSIKHKKQYIFIVALLLFIALFTLTGIATSGEPGSQSDPLVTLSFVEKRIEQIKFYFEERIKELSGIASVNTTEIQRLTEENNLLKSKLESSTLPSGAGVKLEVVELKSGQRLICKAGSEIILRGGTAKAIASNLGGLSDVTSAIDISMNQDIPANHLLIVPRDDGRGVYTTDFAILMIRGEYYIE